MDAIEAILSRRSIRKYKPDELSGERIETLMKAAMAAPSAMNEQPWHFVLVKDKKTLEKICEFHVYAQMAKEAPLSIVVCADLNAAKSSPEHLFVDCAAATENILLAARAMGLGSVWTAIYPKDERMQPFRQLLGIPENLIPFAMVVVGHPNEEKPAKAGYDKTRVHIEKW